MRTLYLKTAMWKWEQMWSVMSWACCHDKKGWYKKLYFRLILRAIIIVNSLMNTSTQLRNVLCISSVFKQKLNTDISESKRNWDFPGGPVVENLPEMQGPWVWSLVQELGFHMLQGNLAPGPQLLSPGSRACAPQQKKSPQWEDGTPQLVEQQKAHAQQWGVSTAKKKSRRN